MNNINFREWVEYLLELIVYPTVATQSNHEARVIELLLAWRSRLGV